MSRCYENYKTANLLGCHQIALSPGDCYSRYTCSSTPIGLLLFSHILCTILAMNARLSFSHPPLPPAIPSHFVLLLPSFIPPGTQRRATTHYCSPSRNHEIVPGNYHNRPGPPLSISDRNLMKSTPQPSIRTENAICSTRRRHRCRALCIA
ncbi:hypothetical protein HDV57DRAFT_432757 [Trichoderma longibrachiatum]